MSSSSTTHGAEHTEQLVLYVLQAAPAGEAAAVEARLHACAECRRELETLRGVVETFPAWPTDVLEPPPSLWGRLAERIGAAEAPAAEPGEPERGWVEPEWTEAAPGIEVKLLASDAARQRVSMLVRLGPGVEYPPHRHAGVEELHLLAGELWIDERKLYPGDFNRAEPGTADERVWSETGCACVLITSPADELG